MKSREKSIYIFDFDSTITLAHTYYAFDRYNMTQEQVNSNVKPGLCETFRAIWDAGHDIAIATHNTRPQLIEAHLIAAGFTESEVEKIPVYCPLNSNGKSETVRTLGSQKQPTTGAYLYKNVYFYDDEKDILKRVDKDFQEFDNHQLASKVHLNIIHVPNNDKGEFLSNILSHQKVLKELEASKKDLIPTMESPKNTEDCSMASSFAGNIFSPRF